MVITIRYEETTVTIDRPELCSWPEAVEYFMQALWGCGFLPHDFEYVNGEVHSYFDLVKPEVNDEDDLID